MLAKTIPVQPNTFSVASGVRLEVTLELSLSVRVTTSFLPSTPVSSPATLRPHREDTNITILSSATVPQWRRIAHLARIQVDEQQIVSLCTELNSILSFVNQLSEVDVEGVEPMTSVTPMEMKQRKDEVTDGGIADDIMRNAPATEGHYFLVPKVVE